MTLTELQVKRDALVSKIANSVRRLQSGEDSIENESVDQMEKALALLDREIARSGGSSTSRVVFVQHSRG